MVGIRQAVGRIVSTVNPDADGERSRSGVTGAGVHALELQEELQRFGNQFMSRVSSAAEPLTGRARGPDLQRAALTRVLLYGSAALDVASGPVPELNMLDMAVLLRLSRTVFERHFLPLVFGEPARPLLDALRTSEHEIWDLATRQLTPAEVEQLGKLTDAWLEKHPDNVHVEMVRFREFASRLGDVATSFEKDSAGLLRRVRAATVTADRALLLSERAIFLAQRMPFLLRVQARLGVHDTITDCSVRFVRAARRTGFALGAAALVALGLGILARRFG